MSETIRLEIMLRTDKSEAEYAGALAEVYTHLMAAGLFVTDFRVIAGDTASVRHETANFRPSDSPLSWNIGAQQKAMRALAAWSGSLGMKDAEVAKACNMGASQFSRTKRGKEALTNKWCESVLSFLHSRDDATDELKRLFSSLLQPNA